MINRDVDYRGCTCMQYGAQELLQLWSRRASRVVSRLVMRGHKLNLKSLAASSQLVVGIERGLPECFSPDSRPHSHHLPGCPWREQPVQEG